MTKYYIDLGAYTGDSIAEFHSTPKNSKRRTFLPRDDAHEYHVIAVEPSAENLGTWDGIRYFSFPSILLIKEVAWVYNGKIMFREIPSGPFTVASCVQGYPLIGDASNERVVEKECFDLAQMILGLQDSEYLVVKMNVETSEYVLIEHLLVRGCIPKINELYIEYHHPENPKYSTRRDMQIAMMEGLGVKVFPNWWRE